MNTQNSDNQLFESNASQYNEVRPGYPQQIYEYIAKYKTFGEGSLILELGSGQGVATQEISDYWKPNILAIEPGSALCEIAIARLKKYSKVKIINTSFENYQHVEKKFDGVFSATAFHWLDSIIKYRKTYDLLNNDGLLAVYWNNFGIENDELSKSIKKLYGHYGFKSGNKNNKELREEKINARKNEIDNSGLFSVIGHHIIKYTIRYSSVKYIELLKTFPDHLSTKIHRIEDFFRNIEELIDRREGIIDVEIVVNLEIAKKN